MHWDKIKVVAMDEKARVTHLRWFWHVHQRRVDAPIQRAESRESLIQSKRGKEKN